MKKQRLLLFAVLIVFTAFFVSCKKQDNAQNNNSSNTTSLKCRITDIKIIDQINSEITLDYNSDKKLSAVTYTHPKKQDLFSYSGNLIIKKELDSNGNLLLIDTIALGTNNLVSTVVSRYAPTGDVLTRDTMTYNAQNELIKSLETRSTTYYIYDYTWANGDVATIGYRGTVGGTYSFYTDKNTADGDYLSLYDMVTYGAHVFACKHLYKGGQGPFNVKYVFDGNGKIISAVAGYGMDSTIYNYNYTCD